MTAIAMEHEPAACPTERFVVVVFDGVSLGIMSFAFGVFDMAVHYGVLPDLEVRVVAGEPATAITGGGLTCYVPYDLDAIQAASLVIVPNWRDPAEPPPGPLLGALRAAHARGARVAGLCSGAFVLAAAGLLDGRPATTHWALAAELARMYPKVQVKSDQLYIDDGDVLTAGGGAAGMDLGLHLLRGHCGAAVANRLARSMVVPPHRPGGQAQYIESPLPPPDDSDPVGETMTWALAHLDQPLPVELSRNRGVGGREHIGRRTLGDLRRERVRAAERVLRGPVDLRKHVGERRRSEHGDVRRRARRQRECREERENEKRTH